MTNLIELGTGVTLRAVIEISPGDFGSCPDLGPGPWTPEQSLVYWRTCLAGSGITDLNPVMRSAFKVFADEVASPFPLNRILESHFGEDGIPPGPDKVSTLPGGFALVHDGEVVLLPTCCGDLGDLSDWKRAVAYRDTEPETIWIGHPWLDVWCEDGSLMIREEQENGFPCEPRTFRVQPDVLDRAIQEVEPELDRLLEKILSAIPVAKDVAMRLAGKDRRS